MSTYVCLCYKVEGELTSADGDKAQLQALHLWSVKQYVVALLHSGRSEQAHTFLQSVSNTGHFIYI